MDGELIVLSGFTLLIISVFGMVRLDRYENEERAKWWIILCAVLFVLFVFFIYSKTKSP